MATIKRHIISQAIRNYVGGDTREITHCNKTFYPTTRGFRNNIPVLAIHHRAFIPKVDCAECFARWYGDHQPLTQNVVDYSGLPR